MTKHPSDGVGFVQARRASKATDPADDSVITLAVESVSPADAPAAIDVIANAFLHDPIWSWAIPDPARRKHIWKIYVDGAVRYGWVFKTAGFEAVSVWLPPGGSELLPEDEARFPDLLTELAGARAPDVAELLLRFEQAHPRNEPHYYLNMLGTHDAHRGRGLGMALLRENLARLDAERMPAYLESSNPANNRLYQAAGFAPVASFQAPGDGPWVTGMWRNGK